MARLPVAIAVVASVAAAAVSASHARAGATTAPTWVTTARTELSQLVVKPLGSKKGYSRDRFGPAWADVDRNHCNTRDDILRRDLTHLVFAAGSTCTVAKGSLHDPYTNKTIHYERGPLSSLVQIDHVVALGDAWVTGASKWTPKRRLRYANDPAVLLAVSGAPNEAKGDSDASGWLPTRSFRCRYVAVQISIKTEYHLWVTHDERAAMAGVLTHCASAHG